MFACLFVCFCLPFHPVCPSVRASVSLFLSLFVCLSVCLPACLPVCLCFLWPVSVGHHLHLSDHRAGQVCRLAMGNADAARDEGQPGLVLARCRVVQVAGCQGALLYLRVEKYRCIISCQPDVAEKTGLRVLSRESVSRPYLV